MNLQAPTFFYRADELFTLYSQNMFLVSRPVPGFLEFMQILGWIALPILIAAISFVVFLHYRRKKRDAGREEGDEVEFMVADAEQVGYTRGDGEYVLFDHSHLIKEYKKRLTYNHARFTALQQDYAALENRYAALAEYAGASLINAKKDAMEHTNESMPADLQDEVTDLASRHALEKKEWMNKLEQLTRSCKNLEEENENLVRQAITGNGTDAEKTEWINKWKEENVQLKNRVAEQECLKDIVEEKNAQISFLQGQLEQRIKQQHLSEQLKLQAENELQQLSAEMQQETDHHKEELVKLRDDIDRLQVTLLRKEEELVAKDQQLISQQDQLALLNNEFRSVKEQNELLHAATSDGNNHLRNMEQQLADEQSRVQYLEEKLNTNRQNIRRLYKEFAALAGEEAGSPVISLRPDYAGSEQG